MMLCFILVGVQQCCGWLEVVCFVFVVQLQVVVFGDDQKVGFFVVCVVGGGGWGFWVGICGEFGDGQWDGFVV